MLADSLRRALAIASALEATVVKKSWEGQPDDSCERVWEARSRDARITIHTWGWYPDASGYSGGEQRFAVKLFGPEPEPRGEIEMHLHQFAGWSSHFKLPPPIADALRAEGIAVP